MNTGGYNTPSLEVIIPVKDRVEVMQCVRSLTPISRKIARIIVCDGGSTDAQCVEALHELEQFHNVRVIRFPTPGFNKSRLLNKGIAQATSDFLLISDADILWNQAALDALLNQVLSAANTICYVRDVEESLAQSVALKRDRYTYNVRIDNDVAAIEVVPGFDQRLPVRPGCGLICTSRLTLIALGGYKEIFTGWGWEDQDLLIRASVFGFPISADGKVMHISHSDTARNRHHGNVEPVQTRNQNIVACLKSLAEGVLLGDLRLGTVTEPKPYVIHVQLPESLSWDFT